MSAVWDIVLDAIIDTAKILPFLLIVYFLIEFFEWKKLMRFENSKFIKGAWGPVFGAMFGCIPQCGFSVVSTELFAKRTITVGTLIAVYLSTSDEALPIMLSTPSSIPSLLLLIATKVVIGILIGFLANVLYTKFFEKKFAVTANKNESVEVCSTENMCEKGCCHHDLESEKFDWFHPILHSLKIISFILTVNLIMGFLVYFVGEENLTNFLSSSYAFQPLFAVLIGLIPNCASSVVITELYLMGGLSFGSIVAGLLVNAGLGILVLFKENKNWKENLFIMIMLIVPSLIFGYALHFLF